MKILILRFSSIGDILLTTPVIRCLANQLPDAEVHFATKKAFAGLLHHHPQIHRLHLLEDSLARLLRDLRAEHFDYILDLHHNLRSGMVKAAMPKVPSSSVDKKNREKWLYVRRKQLRHPIPHIVQRYLETGKPLGVQDDGGGLDWYTRPEAEGILNQLPRFVQNGYDVLVLGTKQATKSPPESLLEALLKDSDHSFVLIGGPAEQKLGKKLEARFPDRIWNTAGIVGLEESGVLIREANKVIAPDTGMMHAAAAFQKPLLSIWGSTTPELGMSAYYGRQSQPVPHFISQVGGLSCRPCSKIGKSRCPKGHYHCMHLQDREALSLWIETVPGKLLAQG